MAISKKTSTAKINSSQPTSSLHPPYFQMICEAITTMKDRTGSSQPAIAKFIEGNYPPKMLPQNFKKTLSVQLKRLVKSEKLVKVKNSYKIPAAEKAKKPANAAEEKKTPAKKAAVKKSAPVKTAIAKKSAEKAKKTKRLSQVKTPEALKKAKPVAKRAATPAKRKSGKSGTRAPAKKAKN